MQQHKWGCCSACMSVHGSPPMCTQTRSPALCGAMAAVSAAAVLVPTAAAAATACFDVTGQRAATQSQVDHFQCTHLQPQLSYKTCVSICASLPGAAPSDCAPDHMSRNLPAMLDSVTSTNLIALQTG
jgi:hypothetical protein